MPPAPTQGALRGTHYNRPLLISPDSACWVLTHLRHWVFSPGSAGERGSLGP